MISLALALVSMASAPTLQLQINDCVGVSAEEVAQVVSLELRAIIAATRTAQTTQVGVSCKSRFTEISVEDPDTRQPIIREVEPRPLLDIRVDDPITGKWLLRSVDLNRYPQAARSRLLALAISELVMASWVELLVNPNPKVPPASGQAPVEARQAVTQAVRLAEPLRATTTFGPTFSFSNPRVLWGGALRLSQARWEKLGWSLDVSYARGATRSPAGTIFTETLSLAPMLFFHLRLGPVQLQLGPGLRYGAGRLTGEPADSSATQAGTLAGPWGGPAAFVTAAVNLSSALAIEVNAEAGYTLTPVRAFVAGEKIAALEGGWFGLRLGLSLAP